MKDKFNFSKIEDQQKFQKLPEDKRERFINEAQSDAVTIDKMVENQQAKDYASATRIIEARKNWKQGHLGVTKEDHLAIGSTPDIELMKNPEKTLGELWSIEKISGKLHGLVKFLEKARKEYKEKGTYHPDAHWAEDDILYAKNELKSTISYLKSIKKLPKEFENIEIQDLEGDPKG